ncbi:LRR receptor serine/threonine-protein kinase ERECTA [Spatholobus suberectus]|nr:LRR receptor serine/threonine-protein kinase ERECTA [Spatholobus suberectus]
MEHLQVLSLSDSHFSGRIPNNLGNLTKLLLLDFSFNPLLYADDFYWISHLSSLQYLYMSDVYLDKAQILLQALKMLPSLLEIELMNSTKIDLSFNSLNSTPFWLATFINLVNLFVDSNALYGSLPSALQNPTSLTWLDLSENNFDSVPSWLGELKGLQYFNLSGNDVNHIEGSLASLLGNCCRLQILDMSRNNIQGDALGSYRQSGCIRYNLMYLDLSHNEFNVLCQHGWGNLKI